MIAVDGAGTYEAGNFAEAGTYVCTSCGSRLAFEGADAVPSCPECGGRTFSRAHLFTGLDSSIEQATAERPTLGTVDHSPGWLEKLRDSELDPGPHLAYEEDGEVRVLTLPDGWCRVGRSPAADIRFDDPTVSRRHALLVRSGEGVRVLDDRSLNGIEVNGEPVEWGELVDGDELRIGRYRLYLIAS